jgi:hypothetical protein
MGLLSKAAVKAGDAEYEIREYHKNQPSFQGIVLKISFDQKISRIVSDLGAAVSLSWKNTLVLIPEFLDRELLAHRLSKSLNAQVLYQFEADDPGEALYLLEPYR